MGRKWTVAVAALGMAAAMMICAGAKRPKIKVKRLISFRKQSGKGNK